MRAWSWLVSLFLVACGGEEITVLESDGAPDDAEDDQTFAPNDVRPIAMEAALSDRVFHDACPLDDGGVGNNTCPDAACPSGYVCTIEIGGVAGGGGSHCLPLPTDCIANPTCDCIGNCGCYDRFNRLESCYDPRTDGSPFGCDNGLR